MNDKADILVHEVTTSSQVKKIQYNTETKELDVQFVNTGKWYRYTGVPIEVYESFTQAPSVGVYLNKFIKGKYPYHAL